MEKVDVYGFGHLLYEMVYMEPLNASFRENFDDCPFFELKGLFEMILTSNALKNELPTLSHLLELRLNIFVFFHSMRSFNILISQYFH